MPLNGKELKSLEQEIAGRLKPSISDEQKALSAEWREDYAAAADRDALGRVNPLERARQNARAAAREPGKGKDGPEIG